MNFPQRLLSCLNSPSWYVKAILGKSEKSGISLSIYFSAPPPFFPILLPPPPHHHGWIYTLYTFLLGVLFFFFFFTNQTMKSLLNYMIRVLLSFFLIFCDSSTATVSFQEWPETRSCCHWGIESMGVLGSTCWHRAGFTHGGNVVRDKWTWWLENIVNNYLLCKSFRGFLKLLKLVFKINDDENNNKWGKGILPFPRSDQLVTSPNDIHTLSSWQVLRILLLIR